MSLALTMISRSSFAKSLHRVLRRSRGARPLQNRSFFTTISSGTFESSDVSGLKLASRDGSGPTTKLAVIAKAGTRYQPLPGLTFGLEEFAFKNTRRRSALRINRESEILGGQLTAWHTREALILQASFLRQDLPYYTELLAEVVTITKYTTHEFHEDIERVLSLKRAAMCADVSAIALDNAHAVAFHRGLGAPLHLSGWTPFQKYLNEEYIASYADVAYTKPNLVVVADGASSNDLSKWVGQFFTDVSATSRSGQTLQMEASRYHGGEQRIEQAGGNSMVIALPGSDNKGSKPEIAVLASLLGGKSTIKWAPGFSLLYKACTGSAGLSITASNIPYSDAGLLAVQLSGSAASVRKAAEATVKALRSIAEGTFSKEDVSKAIAHAKFDYLEQNQLHRPSMLLAGSCLLSSGKPLESAALAGSIDSVTGDQLKATAKALLDGKATVSSVGDLFVLPYAEEIGLRV